MQKLIRVVAIGVVMLILALGLIVVWGLWSAVHPQPVFVVRVEDGKARVVRGKVTQAFLQQIGETCDRHGLVRINNFALPCDLYYFMSWSIVGGIIHNGDLPAV